jgi:hypothetical protein
MKTVTILNNDLFDDGSMDCLNFWVSNDDGTYVCEIDHIRTLGLEKLIGEAIKAGKRHVAPKGLVYGGLNILQVVWG